MTPDTGAHLLLVTSYGNRSAHACTVENARALLAQHLDALDSAVVQCAQALAGEGDSKVYLVSSELVARALQEVSQQPEGAAAPTLRRLLHGRGPKNEAEPDVRPDVVVTAAMKDALALWAFKAGLSASQLTEHNASTLAQAQPEALEFLAPLVARAAGRTLQLTPNHVLDAAADLRQLQSGKWKDTALEHRVVSRYLQFINDWLVDTSDVRYDVIDFEASVA